MAATLARNSHEARFRGSKLVRIDPRPSYRQHDQGLQLHVERATAEIFEIFVLQQTAQPNQSQVAIAIDGDTNQYARPRVCFKQPARQGAKAYSVDTRWAYM